MASVTKYILAVDLGTSGPKVAIVSTDGEVVDSAFESTETILLPAGGAEESPDDWWRAIKNTSKKLLSRNSIPVNDIVAANCTSQWSGTVAVDKDGNPLMNAIIWMDSRGAKYIKEKTGGLFQIEGYAVTKLRKWITLTGGIPAHSGKDPIAHIVYIKNVYPEIYKKTHKFLEPKDYLNLKLTGAYFASYDSIALHWVTDNRNISNIDYDDHLIKLVGIEREKLPDLKRATDIIGPIKNEIAAELGIPLDTPVVMGTPDLHSAAIGSGAVEDYEGHLYVGTSSWLICHVPFKKQISFITWLLCHQPFREYIYWLTNRKLPVKPLTSLRRTSFFPMTS